jgi:hypothetical protein
MRQVAGYGQRVRRPGRQLWAVAAGAALALTTAGPAMAAPALIQVSSDPFTNSTSQHATQVEPDTFAFGSTIIGAFQSGRFVDGGSSDIGWARSADGGRTWTHGFLSGITAQEGAGTFERVSDPSVAYDAKHGTWLISSLPIAASGDAASILVSRSTDGGKSFGAPVSIAPAAPSTGLDKNWTACDNSPASRFYGNCYTTFDDSSDNNRLQMSTSSDGGATWTQAVTTAADDTGIGGQPLVQPDGTVIVPAGNAFGGAIVAFRSTDGGKTWSPAVTVDASPFFVQEGDVRSDVLPSAEIDGKGRIYLAWPDCRFRAGCRANDIVITTSDDGVRWSKPKRVPIDPVTSTADHFIPGLAVDPATSGAHARLALAYYFYPVANCRPDTCRLDVGLITSDDAGRHWSAPVQLAGPMSLDWLADTDMGRMVGDYISTSFVGGRPIPMFALAKPPPAGGGFDEAIYVPAP